MKKFHFKLEAVENVRKKNEDEALRELSRAQQIYQNEVHKREGLQIALAQGLQRREELSQNSVGVDHYVLETDFIEGTKIRIQWADHAIQRAGVFVTKAKQKYLLQRQKRMMITRLREKEFQRFKKAVAKKEAKALDELNVMRARLRRVNE